MGILNVTPDSFSDGGNYVALESARAHALSMVEQGADIIDVGGESTRPGAQRVDAEVQIARVVDVIAALHECLPAHVGISVDTTRSIVAERALAAGATMINDISAGRDDPEIFGLAYDAGVPLILMHMRGDPATMQIDPYYEDVVQEICDFLAQRAQCARSAGIAERNIILDPGIGFGKTKAHNLALLANLERVVGLGFPVLLGTSRKRFMGAICHVEQPNQLVPATCATTALGVGAGVSMFRVHDVAANRQAADVAWAIHLAKRAGKKMPPHQP